MHFHEFLLLSWRRFLAVSLILSDHWQALTCKLFYVPDTLTSFYIQVCLACLCIVVLPGCYGFTYELMMLRIVCVEVLSVSETEDIKAELTLTRQNQKLLSVLSRKSVEQFKQFLAALDKTDQHHITDRLRLGLNYTVVYSNISAFCNILFIIQFCRTLANNNAT